MMLHKEKSACVMKVKDMAKVPLALNYSHILALKRHLDAQCDGQRGTRLLTSIQDLKKSDALQATCGAHRDLLSGGCALQNITE